MTKKLLIATTNFGKATEYKKFLNATGLEIICLNDLKNVKSVDETENNFRGNAILKVKGYFSQYHLPTLADDSGLVIDALDGEPGVRSHRWPGYEANDRELVQYALTRLAGVSKNKRTAKLETWTVFYDGEHLLIESNAIIGYIVEQMPKSIETGFPWRAILFLPQFGKVYRDLTLTEHQAINHRRKIANRLKPKIKLILGI